MKYIRFHNDKWVRVLLYPPLGELDMMLPRGKYVTNPTETLENITIAQVRRLWEKEHESNNR